MTPEEKAEQEALHEQMRLHLEKAALMRERLNAFAANPFGYLIARSPELQDSYARVVSNTTQLRTMADKSTRHLDRLKADLAARQADEAPEPSWFKRLVGRLIWWR